MATSECSCAGKLPSSRSVTALQHYVCSSLQDLQRVGVGPRVMDFGRVSASSSNTAYLLVNNPLRSSIHVVLAVGAVPELKGSEVLSQVCACDLGASRNL